MKRYILLIAIIFSISYLRAQEQDLVQYVNTLQGSHNTFEFSHGRCSPMVGIPMGMNFWAPEGYPYNLDTIYGFGSRGGFSFVPMVGKLTTNGKRYGAAFNPNKVIAKPHYYKVTFEDGISTEITSTDRCGYFKLEYPRSNQSFLVIKGNASNLKIDSEKRTITSNGRNYFVAQFDQPFVTSGNIVGNQGSGVYVEFKKGAKVQFKVSTSRISLEQAQITFDREIGPFSFNEVKDASFKKWNELLNMIVVEGGTLEQKKTFYSCLFRANTRPSKLYEIDRDGNPHFYYNGKVHEGKYHSHPTFWDNFRSQLPLQNIINTEGQKEYLKSLEMSKPLTGWLPNGMIGNHAISVFADAWAKGIRTFNPDSALSYYYHEVTHSRLDESNGYFIEHQRVSADLDTLTISPWDSFHILKIQPR
ncbi:glycoside hydrolase domain-containing protein [Sunxiuqinia sp. A32]|uniref:glycoside hydrolase domain-containing protein n=1 Tax=Sunxiuqinia sp. A32 TaxID=3461496 RepID=UPI0040456FD3